MTVQPTQMILPPSALRDLEYGGHSLVVLNEARTAAQTPNCSETRTSASGNVISLSTAAQAVGSPSLATGSDDPMCASSRLLHSRGLSLSRPSTGLHESLCVSAEPSGAPFSLSGVETGVETGTDAPSTVATDVSSGVFVCVPSHGLLDAADVAGYCTLCVSGDDSPFECPFRLHRLTHEHVQAALLAYDDLISLVLSLGVGGLLSGSQPHSFLCALGLLESCAARRNAQLRVTLPLYWRCATRGRASPLDRMWTLLLRAADLSRDCRLTFSARDITPPRDFVRSISGAVSWLRHNLQPSVSASPAVMAGDWLLADIFSKHAPMVARELASFCWPISDEPSLHRLIGCLYASPTVIVGCEFSGAVREEAWRQHGCVALSVDPRRCRIPGPHTTLDLRLVALLKVWDDSYFFPSCTHQTKSDTTSFEAKCMDGRTFWGIAFFIFCWCVPAQRKMVEQPDTVIPDFYIQPSQRLLPCEVGDADSKPINVYADGRAPIRLLETPVAASSGHGRLRDFPDADARDRWRSSWARFPRLAAAVVAVDTVDAGGAPRYAVEIERFAAAWFDRGLPVPQGYSAPDAQPASDADRRYQQVRGRGDGRRIRGVVPMLRAGTRPLPLAFRADDLPDTFTLEAAQLAADSFFLVFVCMQTIPLVYAHVNGLTLLGAHMCLSSAQRLRTSIAAAEAALAGAGAVTFLAGRFEEGRGASVYSTPLALSPPAEVVVRSAADRVRRRKAGMAFAWLTLAALAGTPAAHIAGRAVWAVSALRTEVGDVPGSGLPGVSGTFRFGVSAITSIFDRPDGLRLAPSTADALLESSIRDGFLLRDSLLALSDDYYAGWAAQIIPPNLADLPLGLIDQLPSFDDSRFDSLSFAPIAEPPKLAKLPLMPQQLPLPPGAPTCIRRPQDLMPAAVWRRVERWLQRTLVDLICIRDHGDDCERSRPHALVVGPGELHWWARYRVFDFRRSPAECATLMDYREPLEHTLNVEFFQKELSDYPNQRILGFIESGVRYRAHVEMQTVLVPHLLSLSKGFGSVAKELKRMSGPELRWYTHHATFPFWPLYSLGEGCVPRKYEDRWRRCEEGGGPRKETFDGCGLKALSINEASKTWHMPEHFHFDMRAEWAVFLAANGLPATQEAIDALPGNRGTKWERQQMPDIGMVMRNLVVLKRAAWLMGEPVYILGDDAKDYFNHLLNAAEERFKVNTVFLNEGDVAMPEFSTEGGSVTFISQKRMGFGLHPNSMIAQEFSEALNHIFRRKADAQEDPLTEADPRPSVQRWLAERRKVEAETGAHERRLYFILMYCDDNIIAVVGVKRALRLIRLWRELTTSAGLIMAIATKRSLGVWGLWVGALIFAGAGLVALPKQKLLRAADAARRLLSDGIMFDEYRSLTGLLEHIRCIARVPRRLMAGLYAPHSAGGEGADGPSTIVRATILMAIQFNKWLDLLASCGGCAVTAILKRSSLADVGTILTAFVGSSDAATDSDPPGLGGFMHGYYWFFQLTAEMVRWIHITVLELLAAAFSPAIFTPLVPPRGRYLHQTDASSAFAVLGHDGGSSEAMAFASTALYAVPAIVRGLERADISHVAGYGNGAADATSRSNWPELRAYATHLRVRLTRLPTPPFVASVVQQVLEHAQHRGVPVRISSYRPPSPSLPPAAIRLLTEVEDARGRRRRNTVDADGPPSLADALREMHKAKLGKRPRPTSSSAPAERGVRAKVHDGELPPEPTFVPLAAALVAAASRRGREPAAAQHSAAPPRGVAGGGLHNQLHRGRGSSSGSRMTTAVVDGVHLAGATFTRPVSGDNAADRLADLREGLQRRAAGMLDLGATQEQASRLEAALFHAADMAQLGAAERTLAKDDLAWRFWRFFCAAYGFDPIVSRELAVNRPDELSLRLGIFSLWVYPQISGRGQDDAKPRTVLNNYAGAVVRVLKRDHRLPVPRQATYESEIKGLLRSYKQVYGTLAMAPRRRQPMTRPMWQRVEALTPGQSLTGRAPWLANRHDDLTLLRLGRVLWKTGHRLGEIVALSQLEANYLTREHVTFRIGGVPRMNPTAEQLRSMKQGDIVLVAACASKPDQFGEEHCPFPSVIEFDGSGACAAAALRDIELERPCQGAARATTPLFARADGSAYSYSTLNRLLHQLTAALFGPAIASVISWHSFRIGLACALRMARCPDAQIQLICRWKCAESLAVYAQMSTDDHIAWLRKAATVEFDALRTANIPQLDNAEELAEIANPSPGATPARAAAGAARPAAARTPTSAIPAPRLAPSERIEVRHGDTWYAGTFTSSRAGTGYDGQPTRIYRILYDAVDHWRTQSKWHDLDDEEWRRI
jgi:hypothetical protein